MVSAGNIYSRSQNIREISEFLKKNNIDEKYAEMLVDSELFGVNDYADALAVFIYPDDATKETYLYKRLRHPNDHHSRTSDYIKVFEKDGMVLVYNLNSYTEDRHYLMDEYPGNEDSTNKYRVSTTTVSIINPKTGQVVVEFDGKDETIENIDPINPVDIISSINNDNLIEKLSRLRVRIVNKEEYDSLDKDNELFNLVENKYKKQQELIAKKEQEQKDVTKKEPEEKNTKIGFFKLLKRRNIILKLVKANKGYISFVENIPGNFLLSTNLSKEDIIVPDGITLKERLYGPAEGEMEYTIFDSEGNRLGVLDLNPPFIKKDNSKTK